MHRFILSFILILDLSIFATTGHADDFAVGARAYDGGRVSEAVASWQQAAAAGHTGAMTALANLYLFGERVPRDPARAASWFPQAAERGDMTAQLNLGDLYRQGLGVVKNKIKSYFWLNRAAEQGNDWAKTTQQQLAKSMTADERRQAEMLLQTERQNRN